MSATRWWSRTAASRSSRSTGTASRAYAWVQRPPSRGSPASPTGQEERPVGPTPQQQAFADYFGRWGLFLPDDAVAAQRDGHLHGQGWSVRFRWRDDGTLLVRSDHRMTDEQVYGIAPDGSNVPAGLEAPHSGVFTPRRAPRRPRQGPTRRHGTPPAWGDHTRAVREAGLDYDHDVPADLAVGNDRQLWRLDGDVWHSEPLRPTE